MTVVQEALLVAGREVRRNLTSIRGIVLLVFCVMGAVIAAMIMAWVRSVDLLGTSANNVSAQQAVVLWEVILAKQYDPVTAKDIAHAPVLLYFASIIGARLSAALVALIGFDAVSGDLQYRAVRYVTMRVHRGSYYAGKVLGLFVVASAMMLVTHFFIWGVAVVRGATSVSEVLRWGPRMWLVDVPIVAAWCGIAQLVGSQFRAPILALLLTFMSFFALWIVHAIAFFTDLPALAYLYPCSFDGLLLSPTLERILLGALGGFGIALLTSAVGAFSFMRRDL